MQSRSSEAEVRQDLAAALAAVRSRWCHVCEHHDHRPVRRSGFEVPTCLLRLPCPRHLLVAARGLDNQLAFVPVALADTGQVGCPMLSSLVLVRPSSAAGTDAVLADVIGHTGRLVIGSDFADERVAGLLSWAVLAAAWQFPDVFAVADAAVLRARHRPVRTLADPAAPDYGRWPAPAVGWASIQSVVPWSAPPFSANGISGRPGSRERALRAVNLPALSSAAHPVAQALVLACLLGTTPHAPDPWTVGTRLLDASQVMAARAGAFVLVLGQRILRYAPPDAWEPLFAQPFDSPRTALALCEIEQADAHVRAADAAVREVQGATRPANGAG